MRILKSLSLAVVLGFSPYLLGQAHDHPGKTNSLYARALFASIAEMEKQWGRQADAPDYHHMVVEADHQVTDDLTTESEGYRVEYLDQKGQIDRYQKLKRRFALLKIFPIKNEGTTLKIGINVYYFSYKEEHQKKDLMYGLSDWSIVEFRFDCEKQEFVISSVKLGGI